MSFRCCAQFTFLGRMGTALALAILLGLPSGAEEGLGAPVAGRQAGDIGRFSGEAGAGADSQSLPPSYQALLLNNEGLRLLKANRNQEAADRFAEVVKLSPELAQAHHNYGLALAKLGHLPQAIGELKAALSISSNLDSTWLTLGGLYQSSGNLDGAVGCYREFLARFPRNPQAPKVSKLVEGLERERMQGWSSQRQSGKPPEFSPTDADYLAEVTTNGIFRWPLSRMPLRVFISSGDRVPSYRPAFRAILVRSFKDWSEASRRLITFTGATNPGEADIQCSWVSDPRQLNNPAEGGETQLTKDEEGLTGCLIQLLTVPLSPGSVLSDNQMRLMCLHEIGHALGLTGHTRNPADVMFYSASLVDAWRDLSDRDAHTIVRLYSPAPEIKPRRDN